MDITIIIRTLNESRLLNTLLQSISTQNISGKSLEIIIVDSGSVDGTLELAIRHNCRILKIKQEDFSFGRSLNLGCMNARGKILVFISGHCLPTNNDWLQQLILPLETGHSKLSYGRQTADVSTRLSEERIFSKNYCLSDYTTKSNYFCNNANCAITKDVWDVLRFNEDLSGLEDLDFAKRLINLGYSISYASNATVIHSHLETWFQIMNRFKREAYAMNFIDISQKIPFTQIFIDLINTIFSDFKFARQKNSKNIFKLLLDIVGYRSAQHFGILIGHYAKS